MSERLDIELVIRSLARSRSHAAQLIEQSKVLVNGKVATKPAQKILLNDSVEVTGGPDYVSRAGHKLSVALQEFQIKISGWCLDLGSSTGGFTQVLLESGAEGVVAIDVGTDQLADLIRKDPRVISLEGTNLRELDSDRLTEKVGHKDYKFAVADLSFISLTLVLENIKSIAPAAQCVLLIKPQFEVGKHSLNAAGIVTEWTERRRAIEQVVDCAASLGYQIQGISRSSILGTHGNTEYLLWIVPNGVDNRQQWSEQIVQLAKREI